jgi:hypothetical protein
VPSIQFQLELPLRRVEEHVRTTYGSAARIVSVREVRSGGIGGFFAHRALDIVVDVPETGATPGLPGTMHTGTAHTGPVPAGIAPGAGGAPSGAFPGSGATGFASAMAAVAAEQPAATASAGAVISGLAGLLADADAGDAVGSGPEHPVFPPAEHSTPHQTRRSARAAESALEAEAGVRVEQPTLSTQSRRFEQVLNGVQAEISPPKPPTPETIRIAPALSRLAGDLVVIAGLSSDAAAVTESLAVARGPYLRGVGGELSLPGVRADDRRGAIGLRAAGVERGLPTLVVFGLGSGGPTLAASIEALRSLAPDQVWLAVDVSRKPEDTIRWVSAVRNAISVDAMAVVHGTFTASDTSAATLGLPEGWSDTGSASTGR